VTENDNRRSIELSVEVPGSPEEVWQTIATGPGITSWFVPATLEEREGGEVRHDFGEMGADTGRVAAWDPPKRVVLEGHGSPGGVLAFEWLVEAKGGGTCIVRLVTTGFGPGEEWDADFDGMSAGWLLFLENLRLHLSLHRGVPAVAAVPMAMVAGGNERAWNELCARFGVAPSLAAGDALALDLGSGAPWRARVEKVTSNDAMRSYALVLDELGAYGFLAAEGAGDQVAVSAYLYFCGDAAPSDAERWRAAWANSYS
jgi:uncharacterized protein YndB with AHSA1/START domain